MIARSVKAMASFEKPANPFPGLRPFEFQESHLFFGRDGQSEQLLRKLGRSRFVAVVGTSGSGKSSLVRAGLLPALYGGLMPKAGSNWRIAILRPSNDPIGNLARALRSEDAFSVIGGDDFALQEELSTESTLRRGELGLVESASQLGLSPFENLLIIVDQFEEIFRFTRVSAGENYQNEAAAFVKLLLASARQQDVSIYIVLTMRSDYLGDCSVFWGLPEAINEGQYLIPRLTRDQLREVMTGPAAVGGADITPRLVNKLLNEMGSGPDQLPVLQHTLMRVWEAWKSEHQDGEPVDVKHYTSIGGMAEALSRHAEETYSKLRGARRKKIAEGVFKCLTERGPESRDVRRPSVLKDICEITQTEFQDMVPILDAFRAEGRHFLLPPASTVITKETLIDITHESLIRAWKRLKGWVEDEAASAKIYQRLAETALLHKRGEAGLWRDPDLAVANKWLSLNRPNRAWALRYHPNFDEAMEFLKKSSREPARQNHLEVLLRGISIWNEWRKANPELDPDLKRSDLSKKDLSGADLSNTNLYQADISGASLLGADLRSANLREANLKKANLQDANLREVNFIGANLSQADLRRANVTGASFTGADLQDVDLSGATVGLTTFGDNDLSKVKGLDAVQHTGFSTIGLDTVNHSGGNIPLSFLRGAGVAEPFIAYARSLVSEAVQFYSCFISYSHADKHFAQRLYEALQGRGIRCWMDEHQILPGDDIYQRVEHGIRLWDKVLLCCSKDSLTSWWVENEINVAFEKEQQLMKQHGKRVLTLIPLNLDDYLFSEEYRSGTALQIRSRLAADFTGWEGDNVKFQAQTDRIIKALRADKSVE